MAGLGFVGSTAKDEAFGSGICFLLALLDGLSDVGWGQGATLSQKHQHGITVEKVEMKHQHKEVVKDVIGRSTSDLSPSESKKLAIKKAIAEAVHKVGAHARAILRS